MYEIYKLDDDTYELHSSFKNEKSMNGTLVAIFTYAVHILEFDPDELEYGLLNMFKNDMDGAHFGHNKTFIYSFHRKNKKTA